MSTPDLRQAVTPQTFDQWWVTAQHGLPPGDYDRSAVRSCALSAWLQAQSEVHRLQELMLADLGDLLRAVGMFDGAQDRTPHELMQEAIRRVLLIKAGVWLLSEDHTMHVDLPGSRPDIMPFRADGSITFRVGGTPETGPTFTCSTCDQPLTATPDANGVLVVAPHTCP